MTSSGNQKVIIYLSSFYYYYNIFITFKQLFCSLIYSHYLPNIMVRYCTTHLKMKPIFEWWQKELNEVCEMRIGFRKGEEKRGKCV